MTLKRQLLLVSLLALMLPWAGCEFIRETETALRGSQQQFLAGTAQAAANAISGNREDFPAPLADPDLAGDQAYLHALDSAPTIDGYFDDWPLERTSLRLLPGADGPIRYLFGIADEAIYLYIEVSDRNPVYADSVSAAGSSGSRYSDRVTLVSASPPYFEETLTFAAEAPGAVIPYKPDEFGFAAVPVIRAHWQDVPRFAEEPVGGYQLEARIPRRLLGTHIGIEVRNTASTADAGVRSASFSKSLPGPAVSPSADLQAVMSDVVQLDGMRMIVTDASGWRIGTVGDLEAPGQVVPAAVSTWLRIAYEAIVEPGTESALAEPDASGREQQSYIARALGGEPANAWFRSADSGRAVVAVAQPIVSAGDIIGAVVLQQSTDAILSLRSEGLARLMNVTIIAMLVVAGALLGYATLLSRRIRRLSVAAERALDGGDIQSLPSSGASDEIGDLSRSFGYVLGQLRDYNEYLRSLASKLSHELRTPLAIVTSSLENLEHEPLDETSAGYTARAKSGADRLRNILTAMSEASRVEELMKNAELEQFDLGKVLESTVAAYNDIYAERTIRLTRDGEAFPASGSPELLIQMLDKLVDNAVSFSQPGDVIAVALVASDPDTRPKPQLCLSVSNPGPPLPERMRARLFDSMVSLREARDNEHLGLGLYIAKLIADGHGGRIDAENIEGGVRFSVWLPMGAQEWNS